MMLPNSTIVADPYTAGTSAMTYGFLRTPGIQNVSLSLIKRIPVTERVGLDLHFNATNVFNHANHLTVNNTVTLDARTGRNANPAFGTWGTATLNARTITMQANLKLQQSHNTGLRRSRGGARQLVARAFGEGAGCPKSCRSLIDEETDRGCSVIGRGDVLSANRLVATIPTTALERHANTASASGAGCHQRARSAPGNRLEI
jgi:hypothetical protein